MWNTNKCSSVIWFWAFTMSLVLVCRCGLFGTYFVQSFSEMQYNFSNEMTDLFALAAVFLQMVMTNADHGKKYYFLSYLDLFFINNSSSNHSKSFCGYFALLQSPMECLRYRLETHEYGRKIIHHLRVDVIWCTA